MAVDYLTDIVSNQAFKPWELGDNLPRLKLELAQVSPSAQALELLHLASFRLELFQYHNFQIKDNEEEGCYVTCILNFERICSNRNI